MKIESQNLPKSQLEITFELSVEELKPFLQKAAQEITEQKPLEGFRPGKAPYEIVKQRLGESAILQHATNAIIGDTFYKYLDEQGLDIVDQPKIDIVKIAPDNPFVYKATVSLLPKVELTEYKNLSVKPQEEIKVEDKEVEKVIEDLRKMRASEKVVDRAAKKGDKVELNFETFIDGVALAGGKAEKYPLVLGDGQMIPGFEEQVEGMKKDDEKEFELEFPKKYHNEKIAGKKAKFKIKLLSVFERQMPELNDDLAKNMGLKTLDDLKSQIKNNLQQEKQQKAQDKKDLEMVNLILEKSKFEDLPDSLINQELQKMLEELKDNIAKQGLKFEDYLNHLKKKEADLKIDFTPDAIKRIKTSIAIRQIAVNENFSADEKDIDAEIEKTIASYKMNPMYAQNMEQLEKNIKSEGARRYFGNVIVNRKVMDFLRKTIIK